MENVDKLLGPFPVLQLLFGVAILGFGVFMVIRGLQKKDEILKIENTYREFRAYEQLDEVLENLKKQTQILAQILDRLNNNAEAMKGLAAAIWNKREGF